MADRKPGDALVIKTCRGCPFGLAANCEHPDAPPLVADMGPMRTTRAAEQVFASLDGTRPAWCPFNKRSLVLRGHREEVSRG